MDALVRLLYVILNDRDEATPTLGPPPAIPSPLSPAVQKAAEDVAFKLGEAASNAEKPGESAEGCDSKPKQRTAAENKAARTKFKNHKDEAREIWENASGRKWPTDANGNPEDVPNLVET